jgi:hypothetical protein
LDYEDPSKPIYLYINSSGTQVCPRLFLSFFPFLFWQHVCVAYLDKPLIDLCSNDA